MISSTYVEKTKVPKITDVKLALRLQRKYIDKARNSNKRASRKLKEKIHVTGEV